jgi:DNA polymerase
VGNPKADIVFIGEAPGKQEDLQGVPFVGRAGKLLDKILAAIELTRNDVYICNILKCRPPNNRDPLPSEVEKCEPYLIKQLHLISPKLIVALGRIAACTMLKTKESLKNLRNQIFTYAQIDLLVTYHPAALLRNPNFKKPAWEDFQLIRDKYLR